MGKKMKLLPSIFKNRELLQSSWQWPSCAQAKTLSFRTPTGDETAIFKTVNSVFSDGADSPESWFTNTPESTSFLTDHSEDSHLETIIRGVRSSERLFFEPGEQTTSSIIMADQSKEKTTIDGEEEEGGESPFKESVILAMESDDPYRDFKRSMQEMVESYSGMKDWEWLQELLGWYLKMNGNGNHGFIVGAFVDLLIELSAPKTSADSLSTSYSSALSSLSSPTSPLSPLGHKEIVEEQG
ncbi:PREDICTED: transcription repressor OFP13 [Ipomoea nil]|uniref:transcription repressor OFP13 n=1 Tax=Ipomoea nil TaxID=35883 RepID=UPI0009016AEC|nr:PREDICTED: transcription repressor OFP13 [Ipomoea nil]